MMPNPEAQNRIRRYLLGELGDGSREELEQELLTNGDPFEELLMLEDELIDDYIGGRLSPTERERFESHFLADSNRHEKLKFGRAFQRYLSSRGEIASLPASKSAFASRGWVRAFSSSPWRIAAYAIVLVGIALGAWSMFFWQSDVDKGLLALNAAYREERPIEARISDLNYAPYSTTRGPATERIDRDELQRAELTLLDAQKRNPTPAVQHALGKVYLAKRQFDDAIKKFEEALRSDPKNAEIYSDLGAAFLERGRLGIGGRSADKTNGAPSSQGVEDFVRSLETLIKALELNPNLLEALFNRALVRELMVMPEQAEEDWTRYLERDSSSKWADEARRRLFDIREKQRARSTKDGQVVAKFLAAHQSGADDKAYDLITRNTEAISGQLLWWQLAGAHLAAAAKSDSETADSYLQALIYAGKLYQARTGDPFITELGEFYSSCSQEKRAALAQAHATIDEAHLRMAKSEAAKALILYQKAKADFDRAGDRWDSLYTFYWIGYCYQRISQFELSKSLLSQLAARCKARNYLWLFEKATTMIGLIHGELNQFSTAIAYQNRSLETSERVNNAYSLQKNLTTLAYYYKNLGNPRDSLSHLQRGLESAAEHWPGSRQMYRNYYTAASLLNSFGYYAAAAEYEKAALRLALDNAKDPGFEHQSYVALAAIYGKLKAYNQAQRFAELSLDTTKRFDEQTRSRPVAESLLQLGHIHRLAGDFEQATAYYNEAVRIYDSIKLFANLYEAHKGRLLAHISRKDDTQAKPALARVLALFETHRSKIREEKNRNSFFDQEQNVYDIAIDFAFSRTGDYQKAFEYSEESRARSLLDLMHATASEPTSNDPDIVISPVSKPLPLKTIQDRMPAQVQILQYAVLEDKVLAWVISKEKFSVTEQKIASSSLTEKIVSYIKSVSRVSESDSEATHRAAMELHDVLIKPLESLLEKDKQICIVPDKALNGLPFNALISATTGRYLIDDYLLLLAPSSSTFLACLERAEERSAKKAERVLSVGDPYFSRNVFPDLPTLPSSRKEAQTVAGYYESSSLLIGKQATKEKVLSEMNRADVIHLASHYVIDEQNPMLSRLLLTSNAVELSERDQSDGVLRTYEICRRKLPVTRLVTLSACQTGVERYYGGEGMIGMSRTFLAAGVPLVAASLWPVASDSTASLMTNFHSYRKRSGLSTAEALRRAQLDMIRAQRTPYAEPYYWAAFVLIGGYASF